MRLSLILLLLLFNGKTYADLSEKIFVETSFQISGNEIQDELIEDQSRIYAKSLIIQKYIEQNLKLPKNIENYHQEIIKNIFSKLEYNIDLVSFQKENEKIENNNIISKFSAYVKTNKNLSELNFWEILNNFIAEKKIDLVLSLELGLTYNDYVNTISNYVKKDDYVLSATGFLHRTVFYNREKFKTKNFFYNIGGMGHLSNIAYITALIKKKSNIFCLEGDGSFLMHLGSQLLVSKNKLKNFKYFLFNNNSHYSTGGQVQSNINNIDLKIFAKSIKLNYFKFEDSSKLNNFLQKNKKGNLFIELKCNNSHISNLPRPKLDQISFGK